MPSLPSPAGEDRATPLAGFAFHVHFARHTATGGASGGTAGKFLPMGGIDTAVSGGFSEISGLEATMEPKVIKSGGRNYGAIQRAGPVTFATVVMKRGIIAESRHLWNWWALFAGANGASNGGWGPNSRCDAYIALMGKASEPDKPSNQKAPPRSTPSKEPQPLLWWKLENAMPVKFRAADLNARGTEVAIEELHLVHEGLHMGKA